MLNVFVQLGMTDDTYHLTVKISNRKFINISLKIICLLKKNCVMNSILLQNQ